MTVLFLWFVGSAAASERNFFYIPKAGDVRFQKISKAGNEKSWPFTVDEGRLTCLFAAGRPLVMFWVEDQDINDLRSVTVSLDPFEAVFSNMAVNDLIVDHGGDPEKRLKLFAPIYEIGKRLCDQPKGSIIGPGEL